VKFLQLINRIFRSQLNIPLNRNMMYLLLRDNKQSGPYTLDDLKAKGLKAYDLVWVDGRSAAWRYPSEVEELSAFAPAVEEQPFDRFFKKPASLQIVSSASRTAAQPASSTLPVSTSTFPAGPSATLPAGESPYTASPRKRNIYVTMPGGAAPVVIAREPAREPLRETVRESERMAEMVDLPTASAGGSAVERTPHESRLRNGNGAAIVKPVAIGFGILLLLAAGIFIGLLINKDAPVRQKLVAVAGPANNIHPTSQQLPPPPVVVKQTDPSLALSTPVVTESTVAATEPTGNKPPKITPPKQKAAVAPRSQAKSQGALPLTMTTDSSAGGIAVVRREAVHRAAPADPVGNEAVPDKGKDAAAKLSLANQIAVGANKYEVGTFGGISDLQVTVTNRSAYPLDLVVVEVQYIQANKKTYKTENLYFHGIGAGAALMQEAPKSSRGIRVQYKITMINSKELGLSESGI
jgi:hypothetical protein